jgi:hypothetical protein
MLIILLARLSTASKGSWIKIEAQYHMEYSKMSRIFTVKSFYVHYDVII